MGIASGLLLFCITIVPRIYQNFIAISKLKESLNNSINSYTKPLIVTCISSPLSHTEIIQSEIAMLQEIFLQVQPYKHIATALQLH